MLKRTRARGGIGGSLDTWQSIQDLEVQTVHPEVFGLLVAECHKRVCVLRSFVIRTYMCSSPPSRTLPSPLPLQFHIPLLPGGSDSSPG